MDPKATKAHLRNAIKERLSHMRPGDKTAESRTLCKEAIAILPTTPSAICAYAPLGDEVDIHPLLEAILQQGHSLYLPAFDGKKLVFRRAADVRSLKKGPLGALEPPEENEDLDPQALTLAFVPGRAFDDKGGRLGRGNGGYDVWIRHQRQANPNTRMIAVALEAQITDSVPMEANDEYVDGIITARGLTLKK